MGILAVGFKYSFITHTDDKTSLSSCFNTRPSAKHAIIHCDKIVSTSHMKGQFY